MIEIAEYKEKIRGIFERFVSIRKPSNLYTYRCAVQISPQKISFVYLNKPVNLDKSSPQIELLFAKSFSTQNLLPDFNEFSKMINEYDLTKVPATLLLNLEDYQIHMLEALPVKDNEMMAALQFRMRTLISYPMEEAAIEYFLLPAKKSSPTSTVIAAISSQKSNILPKIEKVQDNKILLTTINIPELALKNLAALHENDEKSTVILYFLENKFIINISHKKKLYFTRRGTLPKRMDQPTWSHEEFCLEILRYFDYFQSQWRFPSPNRIFVIAEQGDSEAIAKSLSEQLMIPVQPFQVVGINIKPDQMKNVSDNLLVLGCALRDERDSHVTTRN